MEDPDNLLPLDVSPAALRELSLVCVQYVQRSTGVVLDFTAETLPVLDHYLEGVREASAELQSLVAPCSGAYFGELVRRVFPARWARTDLAHDRWRLEFDAVYLWFPPVLFAREAIAGRDLVEGASGFGVSFGDLDALRSVLDVLGAVGEDDYYRLSTRLEVLEAVVDRLMARATEGRRFSPDYYRASLDGELDAN